jgi:hypothetical protein
MLTLPVNLHTALDDVTPSDGLRSVMTWSSLGTKPNYRSLSTVETEWGERTLRKSIHDRLSFIGKPKARVTTKDRMVTVCYMKTNVCYITYYTVFRTAVVILSNISWSAEVLRCLCK